MADGFQTGTKHCGKRRNCSLRAISPFSTVFSKDLYCRHVEKKACLGNGSTNIFSKSFQSGKKVDRFVISKGSE